jgi:hypothetical protein
MKKTAFLLVIFLALTSGGYAWTLKTGTYDLSGGNNNWGNSGYHGEVVIAPQGENYSVIWRIGSKQTQIGVGVLQGDVLSVAFTDVANPSFWGVASYRVNAWGELEGKWTSYDGLTSKPEHLLWKNYFTY